jgi:hypothetical protein
MGQSNHKQWFDKNCRKVLLLGYDDDLSISNIY